jgi:hypothetical protein
MFNIYLSLNVIPDICVSLERDDVRECSEMKHCVLSNALCYDESVDTDFVQKQPIPPTLHN